MVGASILSLVGMGVVSGLLQTHRMTQGSINEGTAMTVSQGYLEQMKNMQFSLLDNPVIDELINQGVADTLTVSPTADNPEVGHDACDIPNVKLLDMNNTPDDTTDDLALSIVLYIDDITNAAAGIGDARRIILRYEFADSTNNGGKTVTGTLFTIRSNIPTF